MARGPKGKHRAPALAVAATLLPVAEMGVGWRQEALAQAVRAHFAPEQGIFIAIDDDNEQLHDGDQDFVI